MNKPDSHIHKLIDRMTCSNTSFAIYRLPWTDIPLLVMQDGGEPQTFIPLLVMQDGGEPQTFSSLKELNGQRRRAADIQQSEGTERTERICDISFQLHKQSSRSNNPPGHYS